MSGLVESIGRGKAQQITPVSNRRQHLASLGVVLSAVALGSAIRIHTALTDSNFDVHNARPLLRSDPALLYYISERIVAGGGLPPGDFRADPRVEYPAVSDLPAMETVGQEFLVAWCYLLFGGKVPLHVLCIWVMGIVASLSVVGVYGLALELTRSVRWAALGAGLWLILEANYRTIGLILMREDLSMPCLALHLFLAARAARTRTWSDFVLAAATLVLAVGSWHAMAFAIAIEAVCVFGWFLRTGQNPLAARRAWLIPLIMAGASMLVPVLRSRAFGLSLPMLMALAMLVAVPLERWWSWSRTLGRLVALGALGAGLAVSVAISQASEGGLGHYSHVFALLKAKVLYLGVLPADPAVLPFEARLLWDGPFVTADAGFLLGAFGVTIIVPIVAVVLAGKGWMTGRGDPRTMVLMAFVVATCVAGFMVSRMVVLAALVTPVAAIVMLRALRVESLRTLLIVLAPLVQLSVFGGWIEHHQIEWYLPPWRNAELAELIGWIEKNVPEGEPIAADFVTSTAILAHTRHPIVLQPKYESTRTRRRIEEFLMTFAHSSTGDFHDLLKRYGCRFVVIDPIQMWARYQYVTGTPAARQGRPQPGSAAAAFCDPRPGAPPPVGGYRFLYRSPSQSNQSLYRVYEVE